MHVDIRLLMHVCYQGQDAASKMRLICMYTFNRSLSHMLTDYLSEHEQEALAFVCQLESLYPSRDFTVVQGVRKKQDDQPW